MDDPGGSVRTNDDGEGLGPEERPRPTGGEAELADLSSGLLRVAALPANQDVLDAALRLVVALARVTVTGADGVSVCLSRRDQLITVAASDATVTGMDRDQYATGEGPCVAAATEGHWFHVESLDDELRWPAFIPRARERGIKSILSTPLLTRTRPVGALNIYSLRARAFAKSELEMSSMLASRASDLLVSAAMDVSMEDLSRQLQDALKGRDVVAQARGALMERHGITTETAYAMLRRTSRQDSTPLRRVAEDIVASTQTAVGVSTSDDA
jgi:transcriptional regulator with GAF, ATPase, and Fis domain